MFSILDWAFRIQRPQHLSRCLAEQAGPLHPLLYVSPHFLDRPDPGYVLETVEGAPGVLQVHFHLEGAPPVYFSAATPQQLEQLRLGLARLFLDSGLHGAKVLVQHAYWTPLALGIPSSRVVYDCMDHHDGFGNVPEELMRLEDLLFKHADLVTVTSDYLVGVAQGKARQIAVVRNACQVDHFSRAAERPSHHQARPVIGYFGAIAEWFDTGLIARIAECYPQIEIRLIGHDSVNAQKSLQRYPSVRFLGERPYAELPQHLADFHVALLPFKVLPLTLATNPVKVYEYLASGCPVVAVDLPEVTQFGHLVRVGSDPDGFAQAVGDSLAEWRNPSAMADLIQQRMAFAASQTWAHRARDLSQATDNSLRLQPKVSVVVLCYNQLACTEACLHFLEQTDPDNRLELIVVDNASSDGTIEWLKAWSSSRPHVRVIYNSANLGFSAGNNVGLAAAKGDYLVVLNNDTVVTEGWADTLLRHFRLRPELGLLGPVTNNIGNEAKVNVAYPTIADMSPAARGVTLPQMGQRRPMRTVAFFCVMISRAAYEAIGPLDERFGRGFFEDDDYCRRAEAAGFEIACAEDVFVHHHLSASFNKLPSAERQALFAENKAYYESKWGPWVPHVYRDGVH